MFLIVPEARFTGIRRRAKVMTAQELYVNHSCLRHNMVEADPVEQLPHGEVVLICRLEHSNQSGNPLQGRRFRRLATVRMAGKLFFSVHGLGR